jgi:hypothetical protein
LLLLRGTTSEAPRLLERSHGAAVVLEIKMKDR